MCSVYKFEHTATVIETFMEFKKKSPNMTPFYWHGLYQHKVFHFKL